MKEGETWYRIDWTDGVPHVVRCRIVNLGKKRPKFYGEMSLGGGAIVRTPAELFSPSIIEAIERCMCKSGKEYGGGDIMFPKEKDPWLLAGVVVRLRRLYRKLRKVHLVPRRRLR